MRTLTSAALVATLVAALAAAIVVLLPAAPAHGDALPVSEHGIVVTGNGSVAVVPDTGRLSFTVSTPAATAAAATRSNASTMRSVVAALRQAGIAPHHLPTTQVALQ